MEALKKLKVSMPRAPRVDIPEFTRCCFCLPLRHGLLVWGYFKLAILSFFAYQIIHDMVAYGHTYFMLIITIIFVCLDLIFTVIFIVAGHLKHERLFKLYYYYSLGLLTLYILFVLIFIIWNWAGAYYITPMFLMRIVLEVLSVFLPVILIQGYVTLLVRTEVRKLGNSLNYEFVNHTTGATSMDSVITLPVAMREDFNSNQSPSNGIYKP